MPSFTITGTSTTQQVLVSGETGFVSVLGAIAVETGFAIDAAGSVKITVLGAVQAFRGQAIDMDGTDLTVDIGASGYVGSSTSDGINALVSGFAQISNFGVVQSHSDALDLRDSDGSALIRVVNHGSISGRSDGMVLQSGTGTTAITNTGTIDGQSYGIFNAFSSQGGTTILTNSGTISGLTLAYGGDDSTETITNTGVMQGGIDLDDGNDLYDGRAGAVIGLVTGENGNDTIYGGDLAEEFDGGADNDVLDGGAGNDTLKGGDGDDLLRGGDGDDRIEVGIGRDTVHGSAGDDTIIGGAGGGDTLRGQGGDDVIDASGAAGWDLIGGGAGNDTLSSGGGNDTFVFYRGMGDDLITDFQDGADRLDLSALGIRNFAVLNGAGGITGDATQTLIDLHVLGIDGTIILDGFDVALVNAADFIF